MPPTILVPGIKGTTLVNTNTLDFDTIWSGLQSKFETIYDLELKVDSDFEKMPRAMIERGDVEDLAYKEAVVVIERKTGSPIYIFGYDWRKSCQENGRRLKAYVDYLKAKLSIDRFNFVTHSLGGAVLACYLKELKGNYAEIAHAVLTVCPFQGSVQALVALLIGEGGINFPLFNPNDMFRKIARTFPAVYELCPLYPGAVFFEPGYRSGMAFDLFNPDHWQSNIGSDPAVREMFLTRLSRLKAFRDPSNPAMLDLARLPPAIRKKTVILVGEGEKTTKQVVVRASSPNDRVENFFDFEQEKDKGDGDGTVPLESSTIYKDRILTLSIKSKWYDKATHAFFLNDGRVQTIINRFLMDETGEGKGAWWSDVADTVRRI